VRPDADASHLRAALFVLDGAMEAGPQSRVAAALARLTVVCHRPKRIATEEAEALWFDTMTKAMMDYPLDVVQWAFEQWRKTPDGQWWPAEAEIRRLCEKSVEDRRQMRAEVDRALRELDAKARALPAPQTIRGPAAEFVQRAQARCTPGQILSYFSRYGMRIEGSKVFTKSRIGEIRVREIAGDIADELGLTIQWDARVNAAWPEYDGPEPTPEEKAAFLKRWAAAGGARYQKP